MQTCWLASYLRQSAHTSCSPNEPRVSAVLFMGRAGNSALRTSVSSSVNVLHGSPVLPVGRKGGWGGGIWQNRHALLGTMGMACRLSSSRSPERKPPTCTWAQFNEVSETEVEITGDRESLWSIYPSPYSLLRSLPPSVQHSLSCCRCVINLSPHSVFVEWIKKLTLCLGALCS